MNSIVFRGLSADRVAIDDQGNVRLTDFRFAKTIEDVEGKTYTLCGTPEYLGALCVRGESTRVLRCDRDLTN